MIFYKERTYIVRYIKSLNTNINRKRCKNRKKTIPKSLIKAEMIGPSRRIRLTKRWIHDTE